MRTYLFVTYCMSGNCGQAMIGVYKRGLRIAQELVNRGNKVVFSCSGRENFHDDTIASLEKNIMFVDVLFETPVYEAAQRNRIRWINCITEIDPDVVVIGEAPLSGNLLEATLCAVEVAKPVVCLDNAYGPFATEIFYKHHGDMFDGIILTGPSSLHKEHFSGNIIQVPPFIKLPEEESQRRIVESLGVAGRELILVMAYDRRVEELGIAIFKAISNPKVDFLFITPEPERLNQQIILKTPSEGKAVRSISPPPDAVLFSLIKKSRLAIVKDGFMQVAECLSLQTPAIVLTYPGHIATNLLPEFLQKYIYRTLDTEVNVPMLEKAIEFIGMDTSCLASIHNQHYTAAAKAADFLENISHPNYQLMTRQCDKFGFSAEIIIDALTILEQTNEIVLLECRRSFLREMPDQILFVLACAYSVNGRHRFARFWGRFFDSPIALAEESQRAHQTSSRRQVLLLSDSSCLMIEKDIGEGVLPSSEECFRQVKAKGLNILDDLERIWTR